MNTLCQIPLIDHLHEGMPVDITPSAYQWRADQRGKHPVHVQLSPMNTEISFQKSGPRDSARYVSATTVCEEALQDSRWIHYAVRNNGNLAPTIPSQRRSPHFKENEHV